MRKDMKFTESEYNVNPLYRRMKQRFSVNGQVSIGDFMRSRAKRDGYPLPEDETEAPAPAADYAPMTAPAAVPVTIAPQKATSVSKVGRCMKRHATLLACVLLFVCICMTLSVIIPVCSNFAASADGDQMEDSARTFIAQEETVTESSPATYDATFDNIMNAFNN